MKDTKDIIIEALTRRIEELEAQLRGNTAPSTVTDAQVPPESVSEDTVDPTEWGITPSTAERPQPQVEELEAQKLVKPRVSRDVIEAAAQRLANEGFTRSHIANATGASNNSVANVLESLVKRNVLVDLGGDHNWKKKGNKGTSPKVYAAPGKVPLERVPEIIESRPSATEAKSRKREAPGSRSEKGAATKLVQQLVSEGKEFTKVDIVRGSGASKASVTRNLRDLQNDGVVKVLRTLPSRAKVYSGT